MSKSGDTCGGTFDSFYRKLETNNKRPMGVENCSRRLQTRISEKGTKHRNSKNKCTCKKPRYLVRRGQSTFWKKGYRKCTCERNTERFLQYIFSSPKKDRRIKTSHQLKTPQHVSPQKTLQNGLSKQCLKHGTKRRLGSISRSKRCIFSYSHPQRSQTVSEILHRQQMLSVSRCLFRSDECSQGIYESMCSGSSSSQVTKHPSSRVLRRLVCSESRQKEVDKRSRDNTQSPEKAGVHDKSSKVKFKSHTGNHLHRCTLLAKSGNCMSNSGESRKNHKFCRKHLKKSKSSNSKIISTITRYHGIMHRTNSKRKVVHETHSVTPTVSLETNKSESRNENSFLKPSQKSSKMVVKQKKHFDREINSTMENLNDLDHRCVEIGVGGSHIQQANDSGTVDESRKTTSHQCFRDGSSFSVNNTIPSTSERQKHPHSVRQLLCSKVSECTGRDTFTGTVHEDLETMAVSFGKQYSNESRTHCGQEKCISGSTQQSKNPPNRMDIEQGNSSKSISNMGQSTNRSVCLKSKLSNSNLLLLDSRSSCICNRCSVNTVDKHVRFCIPTNMSDSENPTTFRTVQLSDNSDSPTLASQTLVSKSIETSSRLSKVNPDTGGPTSSAKNKHIPPRSSSIQTNCMDTIDKQFEKKGFSRETRSLLKASWRSGTQKDYSAKFRKFNSWCRRREIDPYNATLTDAAQFLTDLFSEGLQYRTIAGYRSMLSSIMPPIEKIPVGQHPYIIRLVKGVFNSRPPKVVLVPEWSLPKVLKKLKEAPFEPIKNASLKFLTWKTAFLIAITSFRRCSDLQALCIGENNIAIQKKGITFVRKGLSKQDRPSHFGSKVFIPSFTSDKQLDPKRAVYYYLKKTDNFRGSDENFIKNLFLSVIAPHKPVSSQTISSWIVNVLKLAYEGDNDKTFHAHSTRALGPSWALFNGASVKSIMDTADWSRESTFTRFYLRDVQ